MIVFCIGVVFTMQAYAQNIQLRAGDHEGYSRLVLDLPSATSHSIARSDDQTLSLQVQITGTASPANVTARNVIGVNQTGTNPLALQIKTYDNARFRDFKIGSRLVVDIYDVENQADQKRPAAPDRLEVQEEQSAPAPETKEASSLPEPTKNGAEAQSKTTTDKDGIVAAPKDEVLQSPDADTMSDQIRVEKPRTQTGLSLTEKEATISSHTDLDTQKRDVLTRLRKAGVANTEASIEARPNLITISSTQSFGLAVYREGGRIWMITDRDDLLLDPKVSGPQAEFFLPIERSEIRSGVLYSTRSMPDTFLRTQGGGVLWKVISSPEEYSVVPIEPIRDFTGTVGADDGGTLIFPFKTASRVLEMKDSVSGVDLKVVTVTSSDEFTGVRRDFVEFEILPSPAGLVIKPKIDNLDVNITPRGVEISRIGGLSLMPEKNLIAARSNYLQQMKRREALEQGVPEMINTEGRIFRFDVWEMGGVKHLNENKNIILSAFKELTKAGQIEDLVNLAKMHLANGRSAEALGFLRFANQELPELSNNPEFSALRGAANAYDWKVEAAFHDLMDERLDQYEEIRLWRSFVFAALGDWDQAYEIMGNNLLPLYSYPSEIRNHLGVMLAEVALRAGDIKRAEKIFTIIEIDKPNISTAHRSALEYLKGEAARQRGEIDTTKELWGRLSEGRDDLYRVKSGLALTRLLDQRDEITPNEAIDRLERLRYSWRGDELEAQVNYWLGQTYFENGQHIKGLKIMRQAISYAKGTLLAPKIASQMSLAFTNLYTGGTLDKVSPLDAVAIYEQFSELTPPGEKGDAILTNLAEHLVNADLLDRAAKLLDYQLKHRLRGWKAAKAATRLAAIYLIAKDPNNALGAINKSNNLLDKLPAGKGVDMKREENMLLRARAYSQQGNPQRALSLLESMPPSNTINRLRASIAWDANFWDDAAAALRDVIFDENISLTRPLSDDHAQLLLNRAVSLNLAGDRIGLSNMREKYMQAMKSTPNSRMFEVVTRPRQNAALADRETLLAITSEVDLFSEFLNNYKSQNQ